ncbi:MAG: asparagine synthase-related protein, partial [Verrucomicrobiota bacterium]
MSAICGQFHRDSSTLDLERLGAMMNGLSQFGLDGSNTWNAKSVGLGIQKLWVTRESATEHLPRFVEQEGLAIVANARIDNRAELSEKLGLPADAADSEFILAAYRKWRFESPQELVGDFAYTIWDEEQDLMFSARDFIGSRPFYYHISPDRFLFASDTEGLLSAGVSEDPDFEYLAAHFRHGCNYPHPTRTCFSGIQSLAPASAMIVSREEVKTWVWWRPEEVPETRYENDSDYVSVLQTLLERSIADRLRCDRPIGAHLSGGLDSSTVAVMSHRMLKKQGKSLQAGYSWSPLEGGGDCLHNDERTRVLSLTER